MQCPVSLRLETLTKKRSSAKELRSSRSRYANVMSSGFKSRLEKEQNFHPLHLIQTKPCQTAIHRRNSVQTRISRSIKTSHNRIALMFQCSKCTALCRQKLTFLTLKQEARSLKTEWMSNLKVKAQFFRGEMKKTS